jgi:hypothetical protein
MKHLVWLFLSLACLIAQGADDKVRTWTDIQGRSRQAQFVREVDGDATFLENGKLITIPLDQLSEADRKLIRELEVSKVLPEDARPAAEELGKDENNPFKALDPAAGTPSTSLAKKDSSPTNRVWTDARGNKLTAKFVRVHDENVVLLRSGRTVTLPWISLNADDQAYVRELLTARGEAASIPKSVPARAAAQQTTPPAAPEASFEPPPAPTEPANTEPGPLVGRGNSAFFDEMREREERRRQDQAEHAAAAGQAAAKSRPEPPQNDSIDPVANDVSPSTPTDPNAASSSSSTAPAAAARGDTLAQLRPIMVIAIVVVGVLGTVAVIVSIAIAFASPGSARRERRYS